MEGKVVKKDSTGVDFRVVMHEGKLTFVKHYANAEIAKIEYGEQTTEPASESASPAEAKPSALSVVQPATRAATKIEDKPAFLKKALAKIKENKPDAAVLDLTKLVHASSEEELEELNEQCKEEAGQPLDELLAFNRLEVAKKKSAGQVSRSAITGFEKKAMLVELHRAIEDCRGQRVGRTTIDSEIDRPEDYKGEREDAREFGKHIALTLNLVNLAVELEKSDRPAATRSKPARSGDKDRDEAGEDENPASGREKSGPKTRSANKGDDDLVAFRSQLLALQKVVRQASGPGGTLRRERTYGGVEDRRPEGEEVDRDRRPGRRGLPVRGRRGLVPGPPPDQEWGPDDRDHPDDRDRGPRDER